jgi:L-fuculose-phosphate aldolase
MIKMEHYPDEKEARRDIVEAGRRMYMRGFICGNDSNLSARISENEVIATPSGVSKGFMTEEMLIKTDMEGNVISGAMKPSSEIKMHLAIYKKNAELRAVNHAHPPVASAFAAAGEALDKAFMQETVILLGVIPVAKYAVPGSKELASSASDFCLDYLGTLLAHHGVIAWGDSIMQTLFRMENIEYAATIAMYSKMLGFKRTMNAKQVKELTALRPGLGIFADLGEFS